MSAEEQAKEARLEVLRLELDTVQVCRRRARQNALKAKVAAEREMELEAEIKRLEEAA